VHAATGCPRTGGDAVDGGLEAVQADADELPQLYRAQAAEALQLRLVQLLYAREHLAMRSG